MIEFLKQPAITLSETTSIAWWQIIATMMMIIIAWLMSYYLAKILGKKLSSRTKLDQTNIAIIQKILFFVLLAITILTVLSLLNVPITTFAFISGAVAIGFGFGAKNIIENFLSGWILMSERPIRIGDFIEMDNSYGTVLHIGNRSTLIKRNDGVHITVPNTQILESKIINWSLVDPYVRTSIRVGVSYGSDVQLVKDTLTEIVLESTDVLSSPAPVIAFEDFADSALIFDVFFWLDISKGKELRLIRSDLRFKIYQVFNAKVITIAFPQQDVHLHLSQALEQRLISEKSRD